ncbi:cytochrome d ubiquinol oxidase subunit II [Eilatimonas milleporae]|uniref:Cytochrome bd-I ubiquinol oxidase subunit 2 apoprotein n=1 Tax=Eilatimonas milleporae TaxID=911205 RepID=A0A3M0BYA3_9PROT|nr:cytochrome d ubiquinol oxidase subunit II [Eilatimonas milleporae]RMB01427.1 cytochrome bd-I ubiquinol oxidase subunit 2 apoprotein [Eilatimonas milleporae]
MIDLAFIWAFLIAFAILAYVILDGFDLGIGILFPLLHQGEERDVAMNSVAPVWDGNETWLVLGGGGLYATFPLAYAVLLPALYVPIIAMLLALVFRGVAFEYRWRTVRGRVWWDWAFALGSGIAAFAQGITLGAFIQGVEVADRAYAGGWWDWLTPFSILTGVALVTGYALLGATWLVMKTDGTLQVKTRSFARICAAGTLAAIVLVSLATLGLDHRFLARWTSWPALLYAAPVPFLVAVLGGVVFSGLAQGRDVLPFLASVGLFILSFIGLGISLYPYVAPPDITIWQAAAPDGSLMFLLVGAAVMLPIILAYTAYAYWVFRGKVRPGDGYH